MPDPGLGVCIHFTEDAVVAVAGELDLASAPDVAAVLHAVIDRGYRRITIDASELAFLDAAGLGVLADAYARLQSDGEIHLRGVSAWTYRLLGITGFLDVLHVERPTSDAVDEFNSTGDTDGLARQATRLASDSARADARADTLTRLTMLMPEIITTCDGASVTLRRGDYFITAAASDDTVRDLDNIQYSVDEGPCLESTNRGVQTSAELLAHEERWQSFTPHARERGMESILSSPLVVNDQPVGALNLYSRTPRAFQAMYKDLAKVFAEQSAIVLREPDPTTGHEFDDRIHDALSSRDIIAQAQGVLMERLGVDARAADTALRRDAVTTNTPSRTRAHDIVAETQTRPDPPDQN